VETQQGRLEFVSGVAARGPRWPNPFPTDRPPESLPVALQEMLAGMAPDQLAPYADAVPFRAPGLIGYSCPHIVERRRIRHISW
jgi:hypothetical protein